MAEENTYEYDGLFSLARILSNDGLSDVKSKKYRAAERKYLQAVELNFDGAMMNLAVLYEKINKPHEKIVKYYLMAINAGNCEVSMYNLADYYKNIKDYENMIKYYNMAIDTPASDLESMYYLALYYHDINDDINMKKYYIMALEFMMYFRSPYVFTESHKFSPFKLVKMLEETHAELINETKQYYNNLNDELEERWDFNKTLVDDISLHLQDLYKTNSYLISYTNKIALFKKLNHVIECGICYEEKLNIDLNCAHCVCIDCYTMVYNKPCPFCRL